MTWRAQFLAELWEMDRRLVEAKFPALSDWWRTEIERFVMSGRRRWVMRVGRRGGKSTSLSRLGVAWALFGQWSVPPGDRAIMPFVSVDRDEASGRLFTIREILDALDVSYSTRGAYEVSTHEPAVTFRVTTCSVSGVVGFTSIAIFGDEMAKWKTKETAASPAKKVMGSLRPTLATQPFGFEACPSSPWAANDYHASLYKLGDDDHQIVSQAPTWIANPTITEEETHALEPIYDEWRLHYAAEVPETATDAWFGDVGALITDHPTEPVALGETIIAIRPGLVGQAFGWAVATSEPREDGRLTRIVASGSWPAGPKPLEHLIRLRDEICDKFGRVRQVYSTSYQGKSFREMAFGLGLHIEVIPWSYEDKDGAWGETETRMSRYKSVRTAMLQGDFKLGDNAELRALIGQVTSERTQAGERLIFPEDDIGHTIDSAELDAAVLAGSIVLERFPTEVKDESSETPSDREIRELREKAASKILRNADKKTMERLRSRVNA